MPFCEHSSTVSKENIHQNQGVQLRHQQSFDAIVVLCEYFYRFRFLQRRGYLPWAVHLFKNEHTRVYRRMIWRYMVSSDTARMGILRRAKNPQIPPIIRYKRRREAYLRIFNRSKQERESPHCSGGNVAATSRRSGIRAFAEG